MTDEIKGRARGGAARAAKMTPEQRKAQAMKMVESKKELANLPKATHDGTLKFGVMEFPCAVLSDETRVFTETDFMAGLGMYRSGALSVRREPASDGAQMPLYLAFKNLLPYVNKYIGDVHIKPVKYKTLSGSVAHGIPAALIPKICSVWLDARRDGILGKRQEQIADRAELLLRGLAEVGIIALVDEATGHQKDRARDALARILEAFVAKELQPYVKTFDAVFYEQMFRLRGLPYPPEKVSYRPSYFGHLTNDIVYSRLAPGVLKALKEEAKKEEKKTHFHRYLTPGYGKLELIKHLSLVIAYMRDSANWKDFTAKLNKYAPRFNETIPLDLDEADR
ncbi:MAG: P63C domain-containing protein [Pseudomonadota bacterium]